MTSRERMLAAIRRQEPDRVPFWNLWRGIRAPFTYSTQVERAEQVLRLGLDDTLILQPPLGDVEHYRAEAAPGVEATVSESTPGDQPYPLLTKSYRTRAGSLTQVVRRTDDWPYGRHVNLFDDHNIPRSLEFPIKKRADLSALEQILVEPTPAQVDEFRREAAYLRREADRLGVLLEGGRTALGDAAFWLLGTEALLYLQMDEPDFVADLLDIILEWELRRMEFMIEGGVDVIVHSGWYECTDFWTPASYRALLKPRLRRMVDLAHGAGVLFNYIMTTSWHALANDFLDLGFDSLIGVDPVQGKADLEETARLFGGKMCVWGGINAAVTLTQGTQQEIDSATRDAVRTLGAAGGFVLFAVDQLREDTPWSNFMAAVEAWRTAAG